MTVPPGQYAIIDREWHEGDVLVARFPARPILHRASNRNIQESRAPDGSAVHQEVLHFDYIGLTCGPLVFATDLIDGFKTSETVKLPEGQQASWLTLLPRKEGEPPVLRLDPGYRAPLRFTPYFATGGRRDGAWRLTWLPLAPAESL